jgi:hypothetical protein
MPKCEAKPCTNTNLPLLGNHRCALCKCELHGTCGVCFLEHSIEHRNICHYCHYHASHAVGMSHQAAPLGTATVFTLAASQGTTTATAKAADAITATAEAADSSQGTKKATAEAADSS